jgi:hypothetical protein
MISLQKHLYHTAQVGVDEMLYVYLTTSIALNNQLHLAKPKVISQ